MTDNLYSVEHFTIEAFNGGPVEEKVDDHAAVCSKIESIQHSDDDDDTALQVLRRLRATGRVSAAAATPGDDIARFVLTRIVGRSRLRRTRSAPERLRHTSAF